MGFRDADGIRPLALGQIDGDWVLASESCAFDLIGAEPVREVAPGEVIVVDEDGLHTYQALEPKSPGALCIFEFIYFARPDSRLDGVELNGARVRMGMRLAEEAPADADLVVPIPDWGTPAAIGFARQSGIAYGEALIKNRYVGRTFIQPDQALREHGIRTKFNPLDDVAGKRIVVVDDASSCAARRRGKSSPTLSRPGPPRCTCASPRRRSSRPASTGSTWRPRRNSSPRPAPWRRSARASARRRSRTSRSRACRTTLSGPRASSARRASRASIRRRVPETAELAKHRFERQPVHTPR